MEEATAEIRPPDSEDRLRADVTIAVARVRRLMADGPATPDEAIQPFLEVRERLGKRADGQMGRALRPRIIPGLIVSGIVLGVASLVLGGTF
jgi:cytochrome c-type biogenesis protein CcmH/NrfG